MYSWHFEGTKYHFSWTPWPFKMQAPYSLQCWEPQTPQWCITRQTTSALEKNWVSCSAGTSCTQIFTIYRLWQHKICLQTTTLLRTVEAAVQTPDVIWLSSSPLVISRTAQLVQQQAVDPAIQGSNSGSNKRILSSSKHSACLWGPTQTPIQRVPRALSPWVKQSEREADHSLHLMPRLRMRGAIPPSSPCALMMYTWTALLLVMSRTALQWEWQDSYIVHL